VTEDDYEWFLNEQIVRIDENILPDEEKPEN
jgi:hypothetical protein